MPPPLSVYTCQAGWCVEVSMASKSMLVLIPKYTMVPAGFTTGEEMMGPTVGQSQAVVPMLEADRAYTVLSKPPMYTYVQVESSVGELRKGSKEGLTCQFDTPVMALTEYTFPRESLKNKLGPQMVGGASTVAWREKVHLGAPVFEKSKAYRTLLLPAACKYPQGPTTGAVVKDTPGGVPNKTATFPVTESRPSSPEVSPTYRSPLAKVGVTPPVGPTMRLDAGTPWVGGKVEELATGVLPTLRLNWDHPLFNTPPPYMG